MKTRRLAVRLAAGLFAATLGVPAAFGATSIDVATDTSAGWTVTGGGATNAQPVLVNGPHIGLTSDGLVTGTPIAGFNNSAFTGFWAANLTFDVPAGATDPTLSYSSFFADDRAVLFLNGNQIANVGVDGPGSGVMVLTDGGPSSPFTFTNNASGTITTGFNVGGTNTLSAVINNTSGGIAANNAPLTGTDGTDFGLAGAVTFTVAGGGGSAAAVPIPPAAWTGLATLLGLMTLATHLRRHSQTSS